MDNLKDAEVRYGIMQRRSICFVRGEGNRLFDVNDRSYLDLVSAQNSIGHLQWFSDALNVQANRLISVSGNYYTDVYGQAIEKLLENTGFNKACILNSGLEASFLALMLTHDYFKENNNARTHIISNTLSTGVFGAQSLGYSVSVIENNNFAALKQALDINCAALIIRTVQKDATICDYDYLVNAYALCKSMDVLLICDETNIAIGRTGARFTFDHYGIRPDIITLSRGLGGSLPLGAILTRNTISDCFKARFHGLDIPVNALACTALSHMLSRLDAQMLEEITDKGEYLMSRLTKLKKHNFVLDIRGKGLLCAVELNNKIMAAKIVSQMEKLGYLIDYTDNNALKITPPFTVTKTELDDACDALASIFAETNI